MMYSLSIAAAIAFILAFGAHDSLAECSPAARSVRQLTVNVSRSTSTATASWQNLKAQLSSVTVSEWDGHLQLMGRAIGGGLYVRWQASQAWKLWQTPTGGVWTGLSKASVPSRSAYAVAANNIDNELVVNEYDAVTKAWSTFLVRATALASAPALVVHDKGNMQAFWRGFDNALHYAAKRDGLWYPAAPLGGFILSRPAALSVSKTRVYTMVQTKFNYLEFNVYDDGKLVLSKGLDFYATSPPALTFMASGRVDAFVRGQDFALWTTHTTDAMNKDGWQPWSKIGGAFSGPPAAIARGGDHIDIYAPDCYNFVHHLKWQF